MNGPSGKGVDDLFVPEIAVLDGEDATDSVDRTIAYDAIKTQAVVNELKGQDSAGKQKVGVPASSRHEFSGSQRRPETQGRRLQERRRRTLRGSRQSARLLSTRAWRRSRRRSQAKKLADNTLDSRTAKHGQSPIDPAKRHIVDGKALKATLELAEKGMSSLR